MTKIPYLDLSRGRRRIEAELAERWREVLAGNAYILGAEVRAFEAAFSSFLDGAGVVGVANGTDALTVALRALDLAPGDEVMVPAFSFFATAEAVVLAGGTPVFCDIEAESFNLDAADAEARWTPRTVGILPVHLYGRPFAAEKVAALAERKGAWVLEDAAQAQGARCQGRRVGTLGNLAAWSFYPTKNLGAFGDAGAISGTDARLVERARRVANHGQTERYHHVEIGTNSRLDSLQAAVLNLKLAHLDGDNARRRALAERYRERLEGVGDLRLPLDRDGDEPVYHQLTISTARRDELQGFLAARGIGSAVHYPSPLHRQPALTASGIEPPALPHAEQAAREVLCLPMYAELEEDEVETVAQAVREFFSGGGVS